MRARTGTWNNAGDTSRQSWSERRSCRSRVEQLWLRLWRHRPGRGAARRAEGKGELGSRAPHGAKGQKLRFLKRLTGGGGLEGKNP